MSIKYLAGRQFDVNGDVVEPGDELTVEQVESIPYLDSFISCGYIYPVTPKKGYDALPPHVYSAVSTRAEADVAIHFGENPVVLPSADEGNEAGKNDHIAELANRQVEQADARALVLKQARLRDGEFKGKGKAPALDPIEADDIEDAPEDATEDAQPVDNSVEDAPEEAPVPEDEVFDPSEHTLAEVLDYLKENPDDKDLIIEAEKTGKNRKGIVEL